MQMLKSWYTSKQDVPNRGIIPYMGLIEVFYPKVCVGCSREGEYICAECQRKLGKPEEICPMCSQPSLGGWVHARCRRPRGMERLFTGLPYQGLVQACLKKVKYKSAWEIIEFLFELGEFPPLQGGVVTAVPMWGRKERERGFNQAEMLADLLAKSLPGVSRKVETLERVRETRPMFGLTRKERQENIEGAFRIIGRQSNKLTGQRVILVDDVWTTGATMRECARTLKRAGSQEVWGITLAR